MTFDASALRVSPSLLLAPSYHHGGGGGAYQRPVNNNNGKRRLESFYAHDPESRAAAMWWLSDTMHHPRAGYAELETYALEADAALYEAAVDNVRDAAMELTGRLLPEVAVRRYALWRTVDLHLDRIGEAKSRGDVVQARRLLGDMDAARYSAERTQQAVEAQLLREVRMMRASSSSSSSSAYNNNDNGDGLLRRGPPLLLSTRGEEIKADLLRDLEAQEALRFRSAPSAARPEADVNLRRRSERDRQNEMESVGRAKSAAVASRFLDTTTAGILPGPAGAGAKKTEVWRTRPDAVVTGWSQRELEIGAERAERARLDAPRLAAEKEAKEFQDALQRSRSSIGSRRRGGGGDRRYPSAAAKEAEAWKASFERFSRRRGGGEFVDCGENCGGCGGGYGEGPGAPPGRPASMI